MDSEQPVPFEEAMQQLEKIVGELERGELSLERSLQLFEEGVSIANALESRLADAEMKVEQLLRTGESGERVVPLDSNEA